MNERHPSGYSPGYDGHAYDAYASSAYPTVGTTYADDATGTYAYIPQQAMPYDAYDPLGGSPADGYEQQFAHDAGHAGGYAQAAPQQGYGAGGYDTTGYDTGAYVTSDPYAYGDGAAPAGATYYDTGTYDTSGLWQTGETGQQTSHQTGYPQQQEWDSGAYPTYGYGYGYGYDASGDTGIYEQVPAYDAPGYGTHATVPQAATAGYDAGPYETAATPAHGTPAYDTPAHGMPVHGTGTGTFDFDGGPAADPEPFDEAALLLEGLEPAPDDEPVRHDYAPDESGPVAARSRRRKPAKRSALLTVAVPSVAVMGVAAVGAAAIGGVGMAQDSSHSAADAASANPTTQLDRQLSGVSRDADDFATRANRAQERVDLKDRQAAAAKAKAEAAARKEALRPKFVLPVKQRGLSAYFGQSGEHWMALHTGIDFPVQEGTPVMAATDGTVRTQWNSSYGNMAIVTAPDGTETWYCHLSSTKIRSGKVKAGTVIAYSGNTGNTTGPHLHFEVRPNGGQPIDPLPWLLAHGLDPR